MVTAVAKIVIYIGRSKNDIIVFEFEPRSDKNNALLMHGSSKVIINIIKYYNINVIEKIYKQNSN